MFPENILFFLFQVVFVVSVRNRKSSSDCMISLGLENTPDFAMCSAMNAIAPVSSDCFKQCTGV